MATVVVTGESLAPGARDLLRRHDIAIQFCRSYSEAEALARVVASVEAEAIILRTGRVTAEVVAASPRLRLIAKHGTGVDGIDLAAAAARGIPVTAARGANAQSAAEHALALMLAAAKRLPALDASVRAGRWPKASFQGRELAGRRLGLIGFGAIARRLAGFAAALGMEVGYVRGSTGPTEAPPGVRRVASLQGLLGESDIVSLHCPLTRDTARLIDRTALSLIQPTALLVNTARGGLIDEDALLEALDRRAIAGAALDCLTQEPPPPDHPLLHRADVLLSPHVAGSTAEALERMGMVVAGQVVAAIKGTPLDAGLLVTGPA